MMDAANWALRDVDMRRPNVARVYDFYLGGSHNFAVDREMARQAIELWPDVPMIIRANRAFLRRAVQFLVQRGVRQFLDLGSGIPTVGNVHQVARQADPGARVVYVDIDPVAVEHSRMILADDPHATAIEADLRDPQRMLADRELRSLLDLGQPVAVLMVAVLHFVPDSGDPAGIVGAYRDAVASGSFLAISHATADGQPDNAASHQRLYQRTANPMTMRSHAQTSRLMRGWAMVDPGLVRLPLWNPDPDEDLPQDPGTFAGYAAVGHKQ